MTKLAHARVVWLHVYRNMVKIHRGKSQAHISSEKQV